MEINYVREKTIDFETVDELKNISFKIPDSKKNYELGKT